MLKIISILAFTIILFAFVTGKDGGKLNTPKAKAAFELEAKLKPLQQPMPKPGKDDWLSVRNERGQTLTQYIQGNPTKTTEKRNKLYIRILGQFNQKEKQVIEKTAEYLRLFYGLETKILDAPIEDIPKKAIRYKIGTKQVSALYFIRQLRKNLPEDAAVLIGFTNEDLYPPLRGNFVFGIATVKRRVGVWSIHRFDDPASTVANYKKCLMRTMKTAAHEIAHMFTLFHCIEHHCMMNGANHLEEMDREPPHFCSVCVAKLQYNLGFNTLQRYKDIKAFWEKNELPDSDYFEKAIQALK